MDNSQKTTAFSAHLSWAAMRRYLQEKVSPEESQRIALHLKHCPRCSSAITDYIQTEEPQHYKQYMKKLKGNLTFSKSTRKRGLSAFQFKAIRTTAAVVVLLVFSFFAIKTVVDQRDTRRMLPSESLAIAKKSPNVSVTRRKAIKKAAKKPQAIAPKKATEKKKTVKKKSASKEVAKKNSQPTQKTKAASEKKAPAKTPITPSTSTPDAVEKAEKTSEEKPEVQNLATTPPTKASSPEASNEDATEKTAKEVVRAKPIPTLKKPSETQLSTGKRMPSVAPVGNSRPTVVPVPGNQIRER